MSKISEAKSVVRKIIKNSKIKSAVIVDDGVVISLDEIQPLLVNPKTGKVRGLNESVKEDAAIIRSSLKGAEDGERRVQNGRRQQRRNKRKNKSGNKGGA